MMILRKNPQHLNEQQILGNLPENNNHIAQYVLENNGQLPPIPPLEIHPYLNDFPLQNYDKYIIGTFPPISYIYENPFLVNNNIAQNNIPKIPFYHGNDVTFWNSFLSVYEKEILDNIENRIEKKEYLIGVLNNSQINYADIIKFCKRRAYTTNDSDLYNLVINKELIEHILSNPKQVILNFNTSSIFNKQNFNILANGFLNDNKVLSLNIFIRSIQEMGYNVQIDILDGNGFVAFNNLNNPHYFKVLFSIKISKNDFSREFFVNTTPSPSGQANRRLGVNQVYLNWIQNQPINIQQNAPTNHFRKEIYSHFRDNNLQALQNMNVIF